MKNPIERRVLLLSAFCTLTLGLVIPDFADAQSRGSGRGGGQGGSRGGGSSGDDHGGGDDHASGDDHSGGDDHDGGSDHASGDDHDDGSGHTGGGKGPKYRGGRENAHSGGRRGHSLEDRVLKMPLPDQSL